MKKYFKNLNRFEKIIYSVQIISSLCVIIFSAINLMKGSTTNSGYFQLLLGINLGCNSLIAFKEHKILSIIELLIACFCFVVFYVTAFMQ